MRYCTTCGTRVEDTLLFCPEDGARTEPVPADDAKEPEDKLIGRTVDGRYRVEKKIGEGGMGNVYLATHVVLNRKLALKVLAGEMARNPEVVQRFQQEAQSATAIGHQNIIDIVDFGQLPDSTAYFVMEYLAGDSLTSLLEREGALDEATIVKLLKQMAEALSAAHARGIVHRDLKPDNIFVIERQGDPRFVKVLDFGIAKVGGATSKLTQTGVIFGTPHYMAPEQASGQPVDHRADIYSLGIILYEMCVGKVPFDADTYMGILSKHMFEAPPVDPTVVEGRGLGRFRPVVLRALQKKPEDRYQSMAELVADLDLIAQGATPEVRAPRMSAVDTLEVPGLAGGAPPAKWIALVVLGGALLGVGAWAVTREGEPAPAEATAKRTESITAPADPGSAEPLEPKAPPADPEPAAAPAAAPTATIDSEPSGAEVMLAGAFVGNTPLTRPCPATGNTEFEVAAEGYVTKRVALTASCDPVRVVLAKQPVPAPVAHKEKPPAPKRRRGSTDVVDPWAD